jgi:hypothetical protein
LSRPAAAEFRLSERAKRNLIEIYDFTERNFAAHQSLFTNNSIEINGLQMIRRWIVNRNDANRAYPSAFIRGSVFLGGLGQRKVSTVG